MKKQKTTLQNTSFTNDRISYNICSILLIYFVELTIKFLFTYVETSKI